MLGFDEIFSLFLLHVSLLKLLQQRADEEPEWNLLSEKKQISRIDLTMHALPPQQKMQDERRRESFRLQYLYLIREVQRCPTKHTLKTMDLPK